MPHPDHKDRITAACDAARARAKEALCSELRESIAFWDRSAREAIALAAKANFEENARLRRLMLAAIEVEP